MKGERLKEFTLTGQSDDYVCPLCKRKAEQGEVWMLAPSLEAVHRRCAEKLLTEYIRASEAHHMAAN